MLSAARDVLAAMWAAVAGAVEALLVLRQRHTASPLVVAPAFALLWVACRVRFVWHN